MKSSLCLVLPALLATLLPLPLMAQSSPVFDQFSYQGRVTDANGALIGLNSPVSRKITIRVYDASTNGNLLFAEEQNAIILNGEFSIIVGGGTLLTPPNKRLTEAFAGTVPTNGYWLGVTVDDGTTAADPEITPRQKIIAAPFAVRAATADNAVRAASADNLNPLTKPISLNNNSIFLGTDSSQGFKYDSTVNGPSLFGGLGGVLGFTSGLSVVKPVLAWNGDGIKVTGNVEANAIRVGANVTDRESNAGWIRYMSNSHTLEIVGAGTTNTNRKITMYAEGGMTIYGSVTVSGNLTGNVTGNVTGSLFGNATTATSANTAGSATYATSAGSAPWATAAGRLEANAASYLNSNGLYFRGSDNLRHGIKMDMVAGHEGPALFGTAGGSLGTAGQVFGTPIFTEIFRWDSGGCIVQKSLTVRENLLVDKNVGIGTSNPRAPLHVVKSGYINSFGAYGGPSSTNTYQTQQTSIGVYTGSEGGVFDYNGYNTSIPDEKTVPFNALAAIFEGETIARNAMWVGNYLGFSSDRRAKSVIGLSNGAADLKLVQQLKITDYTWIDRTKDQHRPHKQLIAQDVKAVFPQAVQELPTEEPIPTVYEPAEKLVHDAAAGLLHITTKKEHGFKAGDAVDLYGEKEDGDLTNVKVAAVKDAHEFSVKSGKPVSKVFVYGKRVTDFLTVDYDAIAMLNVSATQEIKKELDAEVKERDAEIKELRAENATLRAALEKVQASFETRLAALEGPQPENGAEGAVKTVSTVTRKPAVSVAR